MSAEAETFVLPPDYTFTPGGVVLHKTSFERLKTLFDKAQKRDPDAFDMYIYNDFFGYAILDLVDGTVSSIHTLITKKKWLDAWHALDALTKFSEVYSDWMNVDDGDRVIATDKAIGALIVATLRGLDKESPSLLNEETIPDLEYTLSRMASGAEEMADTFDTCYHKVLKGYGCKLFSTRTLDDRERAKVAKKNAYIAFVNSLSAEEREERGDRLPGAEGQENQDEDEEDEDEDEDEEASKVVWYGNAKAKDADFNDSSFRITSAWKGYKEALAEAPRVPMRGPPIWDLSKWSAADRKAFSFDNEDEDDMMDL